MAYQNAFNTNTVNNVSSESPNAIGTLFNRTLFLASQNADVFSKFEGPDLPNGGARKVNDLDVTGSTEMGYPVVRSTDLSKGRGKTVIFTVLSQLGGFGKVGEQRLRGTEEKPRTGTYSVVVDMVRHATAYSEVIEQFMAAGASYEEACAMLLGDWFGRKKQDHALWILRQRRDPTNTLFAGGKTSVDNLLSTDLFSTTTIGDAHELLISRGAKSTKVSRNKVGALIQKYMFFGTDRTLKPLKSESLYVYALAEGGKSIGRDNEDNPLWDGGYANWDGNGIFHWGVQDPDYIGADGCMIEARGRLGTPIAADGTGAAALAITFGGVASPDATAPYSQYFPGYDFKLWEAQPALNDTGAYYLIVYNHIESTPGAGDQGKFGFYRYTGTGNNGNSIAIDQRLASAAAGTYNLATVGGVTWNATLHTMNHPTGAPIALANAKGVPYAWVFGLGANAVLRAYGQLPVEGKRVNGEDDYGMDQGMAIKSIFGTDVSRDTLGLPRNYCAIACAVQPFGMSLPAVTR